MSQKQINQLQNRILKKGTDPKSQLTDIMGLIKDFGCLSEIIGRDYEVLSPKGDLLCTIRQKPMAMKQLNNLLKELDILHKVEEENSKPKGKRLGRRKK